MKRYEQPSLIEKGVTEPTYPDATFIKTIEITTAGEKQRLIDLVIMPNAPQPGSFWYEKVAEFYTNGLSEKAKVSRFHTAFDSFSQLEEKDQNVLLGIDGLHAYYGAVDRETNQIVCHASRTNYKKDAQTLCEVAVATASSKDYLKKGIALELLNNIISDAKAEGVNFLELNTNVHNKAVNTLNDRVIKDNGLIAFQIPDPSDNKTILTFIYTGSELLTREDQEKYVAPAILKGVLDSEIYLSADAREIIANSGLRFETHGRDAIKDRIAQETAAKSHLILILRKYHPSFKKRKKPVENYEKKSRKGERKKTLGILPKKVFE